MSNPQPISPSGGASGTDVSPAVALADAYIAFVQLCTAGWRIRDLEYLADSDAGFVRAESPTHRVVTVRFERSTGQINQQRRSGSAVWWYLLKAAYDVASLGHRDVTVAVDPPLLGRLREMVERLSCRYQRPEPESWWCADPLPCLPAELQPSPAVRAAAWLLARLIGEYGWQVSDLGDTAAAGGFIADIPGDTLVVFPAGMDDDQTAAAALALLIPALDSTSIALLAVVDYRQLWAVRRARPGR